MFRIKTIVIIIFNVFMFAFIGCSSDDNSPDTITDYDRNMQKECGKPTPLLLYLNPKEYAKPICDAKIITDSSDAKIEYIYNDKGNVEKSVQISKVDVIVAIYDITVEKKYEYVDGKLKELEEKKNTSYNGESQGDDYTYTTYEYNGDKLTKKIVEYKGFGSSGVRLEIYVDSYEYDENNWMIKETRILYKDKSSITISYADGARQTLKSYTKTYEYDKKGIILSSKLEVAGSDAVTYTYTFDTDKRLSKVVSANYTQTFDYNKKGNLEEIIEELSKGTITTTFEYNDQDQITQQKLVGSDGSSATVFYNY